MSEVHSNREALLSTSGGKPMRATVVDAAGMAGAGARRGNVRDYGTEKGDSRSLRGEGVQRCCGTQLWTFISALLPIVEWLPKYKVGRDLQRDFVAGVTVGIMAVPQAMSYATVAGLPPQYGLFNALMGMLPYPAFGTSQHLISGPTAVMSILVAGLVPDSIEIADPALNDGYRHITLAGACSDNPSGEACGIRIKIALTLSLFAAVFQITVGLFKLGSLVKLVSEPVIVGFTTGSAFLIASTQFSNILGISKAKGNDSWGCNQGFLAMGLQGKICNAIHKVSEGSASWQTIVLGLCCLVLLYTFKIEIKKRIPQKLQVLGNLGPLTVMVLCIPLMYATDSWGGHVKVVGSVCQLKDPRAIVHPECLPTPQWPLSIQIPGNHSASAHTKAQTLSVFSIRATNFGQMLSLLL